MFYANRKEIFVGLVLVGVFLYDFSKELPDAEEFEQNIPRKQKNTKKAPLVQNQIPRAVISQQDEDILSQVLVDSYEGEVGNITIKVQDKARLVVYNRVPKCGSQTMSMLINHCSRKNTFKSKQVFLNGEVAGRSYGEQVGFIKDLYKDLEEIKPKEKPICK